MKYARMPERASTKVPVPHLNGGVNVYDVPNRVGDNQLTECDNLWWHKGALRTRPGVAIAGEWLSEDNYTIRQRVNEQEMLLMRFAEDAGRTCFYASHLSLTKGIFRLREQGYSSNMEHPPTSALGIRARKNDEGYWYFLLNNSEIIKDTPAGWTKAEPYIPTVMINGVGEDCEAEAEPSAYEDYNMLTRAFQCHYTTDGASYTWKLPEDNLSTSLPGAEQEDETGGILLKVELDVSDGTALRTVKVIIKVRADGQYENYYIDENGDEQQGYPEMSTAEMGLSGTWNGLRLHIEFNPQKGFFKTIVEGIQSTSTHYVTADPLPYITTNNLRVTVWRNRKYEKDRLTICKMTRGEWFGGDSSGIVGGTRYFVCGNPDEPDLLCWSGIEHPLYFPAHNRVRVGDDHQAITAMGKQGSLLVLYKERETYALQYSAGTEADYAFAESGGVAITSYMAKFLLLPINASVGCDCPDTVRLVNNRLVWACSDGSVYMLTATNQYSERNVRMISRNVRRLLTDCGGAALKDAQAGEYKGYYLLLAGNRMFLMNTQTSAFASFNYYDDEDAAAKAIPWFAWTLPAHLTYTGMLTGNNQLRMVVKEAASEKGALAMLSDGEDTDNGEPIPCRMTTKMWDFGVPDRKKSIEEIYIGVGCADLPGLQVTYVTERGRVDDPYRLKNGFASGEGYILQRRLTPNVRMVQAFGVCLDSRSAIEVDGLCMKIRQQGVVR